MTVTADKPFIFTIYKPGDPYKMVVDLPDVRLGAFTTRITSQKAGITEVVPSQTESSSPMARLEVLLQNPSSVEQDYKNNILTMKIKGDAAEKQDPVKETRTGEPLPGGKRELLVQREGNPYPMTGAAESKTGAKATEISDISFETYGNTVKVLIKGNGCNGPQCIPPGRTHRDRYIRGGHEHVCSLFCCFACEGAPCGDTRRYGEAGLRPERKDEF